MSISLTVPAQSHPTTEPETYYRKLLISVPKETSWEPIRCVGVVAMLFAEGRDIQLRIEATATEIVWAIVVAAEDVSSLSQIIYNVNLQTNIVATPLESIDYGYRLYHFHLLHPFIFPIQPIGAFSRADPLFQLVSVMGMLEGGERMIYQLTLRNPRSVLLETGMGLLTKSGLSDAKYKDVIDAAIALEGGVEDIPTFDRAVQRDLQGVLKSPLKEVAIAIKLKASQSRAQQLIKLATAAFSAFDYPEYNRIVPAVKGATFHPAFTAHQLSALWHLPCNLLTIPKIVWAPKSSPVPNALFDESYYDAYSSVLLGQAEQRGERFDVPLSERDRATHINIIGASGMGKSTLMHNLIHQNIEQGKGVAVIDPHGDLIRDVLKASIEAEREQDVVLFTIRDEQYPIGLNLLAPIPGLSGDVISSHALSVLKKMFADSWSETRMETVLDAALRALQFVPGSTLQDIPLLLLDSAFRASVLPQVKDLDTVDYWVNTYEPLSKGQKVQIAQPITNRIRRFYRDPIMRRIVCQESSLDFGQIIETKKIFLADVSAAADDDTETLGTLLLSKFQLAAMGRAMRLPEERTPFYLYIDEVQRFVTTSLPQIFSEARKFGLSLTVGNQHLSQLEGSTLDAVLSNVGTTVMFRVRINKDARALESLLFPLFKNTDLLDLERGQAIIKMQVDGQMIPPYLLETYPPLAAKPDAGQRVGRMLRYSREQYAQPKDVVDEQLMKRHKQTAEQVRQAQAATKKREGDENLGASFLG